MMSGFFSTIFSTLAAKKECSCSHMYSVNSMDLTVAG
jgi:hypothetical protein